MNFKSEISDAITYTLRDWKGIVLLGIILCIASTVEEVQTDNINLYYFLLIASAITLLFEEGYRYNIIKNTVQKKFSHKVISDFREFMKEGFIELITAYIFIAIMYPTYTLSDQTQGITSIIFTILQYLVYFLFYASAVNKVLHGGKFISGLNFIEIFKLYYNIGLKRVIFVIILVLINLTLLYHCVLNLGIFRVDHFLDFIVSFFLNPILMLTITRFLAISGKEYYL